MDFKGEKSFGGVCFSVHYIGTLFVDRSDFKFEFSVGLCSQRP